MNVPSITAKNKVGLEWDSLTFSGGSAILDFELHYAQGSGSYLVLESRITETSYTASGLTTGVVYSFKIKARNTYGLSDFSNEV